MEPALGDLDLLGCACAADAVDQSVFERDAAGPPALEVAFQGFWLAGAHKRRALAFADETIKTRQGGRRVILPVEIIRPRLTGEQQFHASAAVRRR
jgi:hypothetical protein